MIYADYRFYKTCYGGNIIPEDRFNQAALQASVDIDYMTNGKAKDMHEHEAVKLCCCAIAEAAYRQAQTVQAAQDNPGVASERVGEYSVSYRAPAEIVGDAEAAYNTAARNECVKYLARLGLLYRGVNYV